MMSSEPPTFKAPCVEEAQKTGTGVEKGGIQEALMEEVTFSGSLQRLSLCREGGKGLDQAWVCGGSVTCRERVRCWGR